MHWLVLISSLVFLQSVLTSRVHLGKRAQAVDCHLKPSHLRRCNNVSEAMRQGAFQSVLGYDQVVQHNFTYGHSGNAAETEGKREEDSHQGQSSPQFDQNNSTHNHSSNATDAGRETQGDIPHFRLPTREEAIALREESIMPLEDPAFEPWNTSIEEFNAPLRSLNDVMQSPDRDFYIPGEKYYHDRGGHVDSRFSNTILLSDRRWVVARFITMLAAFMQFSDEFGFHPFLAYGSLLGLSWTNRMTEYDDDIDLQISYQELERMVEFNFTQLNSEFLLDINPHFRNRHVQPNEQNIIDARIIDQLCGIFIDITALSLINPLSPSGLITCKSPHTYVVNDLLPLRRSRFESIEVWIPHDVTAVLRQEYSLGGYGAGPFHGWCFNFLSKMWEMVERRLL